MTVDLGPIFTSDVDVSDSLRGIINSYKRHVDEKAQLIQDYPTSLEELIKKQIPPFLISIDDKDPNLCFILAKAKKNSLIEQHYSDKRLIEIIIGEVSHFLETSRSWTNPPEKIAELQKKIDERIRHLQRQTYAFQIIHLNYYGPDLDFGNYKLVTLYDLKVVSNSIDEVLPRPDPKYKNFIMIEVNENESSIAAKKANTTAVSLLALLNFFYPHNSFDQVGRYICRESKW
jgi:hypothetical protein